MVPKKVCVIIKTAMPIQMCHMTSIRFHTVYIAFFVGTDRGQELDQSMGGFPSLNIKNSLVTTWTTLTSSHFIVDEFAE